MTFMNDIRMEADLDRHITGNYGEDDPALQPPEPEYDPREDEPQDFSERRCEDD